MKKENRYFSSGPGQGNQHDQLVNELAPAVEFVRRSLLAGDAVSDIALALQRQGFVGIITFICVFSQATDAGIAELKGFSRWWAEGTGPTDSAAFDEYAKEIGLRNRVTSS